MLLVLLVLPLQDKAPIQMISGTLVKVDHTSKTATVLTKNGDISTISATDSTIVNIDGKRAAFADLKPESKVMSAAIKNGSLFRLSIETKEAIKAKADAATKTRKQMLDAADKAVKAHAASEKQKKESIEKIRKQVTHEYDKVTGVTFLRSTDIDGGFSGNAYFYMDATYGNERDTTPTVSINFVVIGGTDSVSIRPLVTFLCDDIDRISTKGRDVAGLFDRYLHIDIPLLPDQFGRISRSKKVDIKIGSLNRTLTPDDIAVIKNFVEYVSKETERRASPPKEIKP